MSYLCLTADDQRRLSESMSALLAPLDFPDADAWRRAVNQCLRRLMRADTAIFILPIEGRADCFSEEFSAIIKAYPEMITPVIEPFGVWRQMRTLSVASRQMLWGRALGAYYRSIYWNEYARPHRAYDGLTINAPLGPKEGFDHMAQLIFNHDSPHKTPFGERGLALGQLFLPAFQAGAAAWLHLGEMRSGFSSMVDRLCVPVLLCDLEGRVLHQNAAFEQAMEVDLEGDRLLDGAVRLARSAGALVHGRCTPEEGYGGAAKIRLKTRTACYQLTASCIGSAVTGYKEAVLVMLEQPERRPPSLDALKERFGLTPQQARVALLLARRKTSPEIAETLCISIHTARRHVEAVLAKIDIQSRRDVKSLLSSCTRDQ